MGIIKTDIFSQIRLKYNSFTNTEKKVADYILENGEKVVYMSITDLAYACNVADSSVFRFANPWILEDIKNLK